jgi:hypothetical protein
MKDLKEAMAFQNLSQGASTWSYPDGSVFRCVQSFGQTIMYQLQGPSTVEALSTEYTEGGIPEDETSEVITTINRMGWMTTEIYKRIFTVAVVDSNRVSVVGTTYASTTVEEVNTIHIGSIAWSEKLNCFVLFCAVRTHPTSSFYKISTILVNSDGTLGRETVYTHMTSAVVSLVTVESYPNKAYYVLAQEYDSSAIFKLNADLQLVPYDNSVEPVYFKYLPNYMIYWSTFARTKDGTFIWCTTETTGEQSVTKYTLFFNYLTPSGVRTKVAVHETTYYADSNRLYSISQIKECEEGLLYIATSSPIGLWDTEGKHLDSSLAEDSLCELRYCKDKMRPDVYTVIVTADRVSYISRKNITVMTPVPHLEIIEVTNWVSGSFAGLYYSSVYKLIFVYQISAMARDQLTGELIYKPAAFLVYTLDGNQVYRIENGLDNNERYFTDITYLLRSKGVR